ncbi:MAG: hypothetical protein EXR72_23475, partial [Myxococcales bacterium]|nr:hypothetical protein [Myxococcales bacterium]
MSAPNHHMSCLREVPLLGPLAAVVLFCALRPIWDGDEWWHVTVGRFILDSGRLPTVDVWSAADPAPEWRSIQWGWQVVAAWIDRLGGLEALRRANAAWICATFIAFYLLVRRGGERRAIALLLGAALLESFHDRFRVRPMVVSATLWLALAFLVADLRAARVRHAVALGALFASWSMIHGGEACLAMIGLLFTCAAGVALRGRR